MSARRSIELLIEEAKALSRDGQYTDALRAAERAASAAQELGELGLEIRAVLEEADAHRVLGDKGTSVARFTWVLAMVEDRTLWSELERAGVTPQITRAYMDWVDSALFVPEIPSAQIFDVLAAGEGYVQAIGRPEWRSGILYSRSLALRAEGRSEEAVAPAKEAVVLKQRHPDAPGYPLATYRRSLADLLYRLDRVEEAEAHYQEVPSDPECPSFDNFLAHKGLAQCALRQGDPRLARREAEEALRFAQSIDDSLVGPALEILVLACRRLRDLPAARAAAEQHVAAGRVLGKVRLYAGLRDALDVALDERRFREAQAYLGEVMPLAQALDRKDNMNDFSASIEDRRVRLARLIDEG